ncbi:MAG: hypothetical protein A2499_01355 [Stygiobacter sp. RIFOXYC12_FULL_38_8]|nr:MAG: hypothetical protein A2X62_09490 [Stygiobacter sp. GWC2_38_9]OGV08745.1 MAG: hypothetical protein A2299_01260 [Stygiobacter sp. RIFOXYB2_FULL_37_11]OGV10176.1 MAG: hypothetical protein A2237_10605 [Stygiobacter sp. RIFOXYA2_FULL_38_8]OGV13885.1 MAG: hypothetical protein A2440_12075 [Stygiobacter sp. RIFOXYC2_FULL_38_25]OGV26358.1 MAG: hypothetical protein A2499_01355 [Stygiobacter sp. RIFOXYC12_FULL_38_8]OGV80269.1 MAG: hypothetical protein A2X65_04025 [Stygiobacter sp. GWF2_38_21]OGV
MAYYNSKVVNYTYDEAITKVTEELKKEGFGILTEIDVKETLKKKLDVDFRRYKILGACNPPFAYKALQAEENLGVLLPCNIVVQEKTDSTIQVSVINPLESMQAVQNEALGEVAIEVSAKLKKVLENL